MKHLVWVVPLLLLSYWLYGVTMTVVLLTALVVTAELRSKKR